MTSGIHTVRAVQYDDSNEITFYREQSFEMK